MSSSRLEGVRPQGVPGEAAVMWWFRKARRGEPWVEDRGVTTVEYGIIIAGVGILAVGGLLLLRDSSTDTFQATTAGTGVCVGNCNAYSTLPSPAIPTPPTIGAPTVTTSPATSISASGATLSALVNANGAVTTALTIKYDTVQATVDGGGGSAVVISPTSASGNTSTTVSGTVSGLAPNTTYYFRASATNAQGTTNGGTLSFTTGTIVASAPTVTTNPAAGVTDTSASLSALVNANNAFTTALSIKYDTVQATVDGGGGSLVTISPTSVSGNTSTTVSGTVSGLAPNTTYYFRAAATNSVNTTNGATLSFVTSSGTPTASVSTESSVTASGATLNGSVTANGSAVDVEFCVGTGTVAGACSPWTPGSPNSVSGTTAQAVSLAATGLSPATTYNYWVRASRGATIVTSTSYESFTTASAAQTAATSAATGVTASGATLNGVVTANGATSTVTFCHSTVNDSTACSPWAGASPGSVTGTIATNVSRTVGSLQPFTTYYFWVRATRGSDVVTSSADSFTTASEAPTVSVSAPSGVGQTTATLNGSVTANGSAVSIAFCIAQKDANRTSTTCTPYSAGDPSSVSGSTPTGVSRDVTGLTKNTQYEYWLRVTRGASTYYSSVEAFKTPNN